MPAQIDSAALQKMMREDACLAVDVREAGEYRREHVAGTRSMPLSGFDAAALARAGRPVVLVCASGARAAQAATRLAAAGCDARVLTDGLQSWKQAGLPVVEDRTAPLPIMRQVQIVAGGLVLAGVLLGTFVAPVFYALAGFVGAGLMFAGITGWCGMALLLGKLPYNKPA